MPINTTITSNTATGLYPTGITITSYSSGPSTGGGPNPDGTGGIFGGVEYVIIRIILNDGTVIIKMVTPQSHSSENKNGGVAKAAKCTKTDYGEVGIDDFSIAESLTADLGLARGSAERDWINKTAKINDLVPIYAFLNENNSIEAKDAAKTYIRAEMNNLLTSPYNNTVLEKVYCCMVSPIGASLGPMYYNYVTTQIAIIKSEYPLNYKFSNWELAKIYMEANLDALHIGLDVIGLVPAFGEVADIANGVIYTIEGDGVNASLSYASSVPLAGWAAAGTKVAIRVNKAITIGTQVRLTWRVLNNGIVYFGYSGGKLRKVLGITDSALHAHHIIPWAHKNHELVQKAAKSGSAFHINEALNGLPRPKTLHLTGHNIYNDKVELVLDRLYNDNMSYNEAYEEIFNFTEYLDNLIRSNPNLTSGEIANLIHY